MMDLAQERERILAKEAYGVKTTRDWNRYHEEWARQHPAQARVRKVLWSVLLPIAVIIAWAPVWVPLLQLIRRMLNV